MKHKNLLWLVPVLLLVSCIKSPVYPENAGPKTNFLFHNNTNYEFNQFFIIADTSDFAYHDYQVVDYTLFYCSPGITLQHNSSNIYDAQGKGDILIVHMSCSGFPLSKSYFSMNSFSAFYIEDIQFLKGYDFDLQYAEDEFEFTDLESGYLKVEPSNSIKDSYKMDLKFKGLIGKFEGVHTIIKRF